MSEKPDAEKSGASPEQERPTWQNWGAELLISSQGSPTYYCNRFFVARTGALVRIAFGELFLPQDPPSYRAAVAMHTEDTKALAALLIETLGSSGAIKDGTSFTFKGGDVVISDE